DILDTFGEANALHHTDDVDKKARKKSLRFHTSKIESASARRQAARNNALGGDDDIPYQERKTELAERLAKEATARGVGQGGDDLDDSEPPDRMDVAMDAIIEDEGQSDGEDYYELVKKSSRQKKEQKKAAYDAARVAEG